MRGFISTMLAEAQSRNSGRTKKYWKARNEIMLRLNLNEPLHLMLKNEILTLDNNNNLIDRISKSSNPTLISRYEASIESETAKQKALQENIDQAENKVLSIETLKTSNFADMLTINELFPTIEESRRFVRFFIKKIEFDETSGDINISFNI